MVCVPLARCWWLSRHDLGAWDALRPPPLICLSSASIFYCSSLRACAHVLSLFLWNVMLQEHMSPRAEMCVC
eukprot:3224868-Prymnesium_polylepis.1